MTTKIGRFLLAAALAAPAWGAARADDLPGPRPGVEFGGRAAYYRPKDADNGAWMGGAQLRVHATPVLAFEGSVDYRQNAFGGVTIDVFPVQASLLLYLAPGFPVSPYILGGGGWYYTNVRGASDSTTNRFGPHAGAGLEFYFNKNVSVDASWRYLWTERIHSQDAAHPLGRDFADRGWMATAGLNYSF